MRRVNPVRSAFTLIEVMVSILVLAIALTAVLSVTAYGINEGQEVIYNATAVSAAKSVMANTAWPTDDPDGDGFQAMNVYELKRETASVDLPTDPNDASKTISLDQVTVTVRARGKEILVLTGYQRED